MSLDEKLFYYLWKSKKRLFDRQDPEFALKFEEIQDRLTILSSMLAQTGIKTKKGKYMGGLVGDTLFFPSSVYVSENREDNELVYLHNVCFALTAKELGYVLKYDSVSPFRRLVLSIVAAPSVWAKMNEEYPSLVKQSQGIYKKYLEASSFYRREGSFVKLGVMYETVYRLTDGLVRNWHLGAEPTNSCLAEACAKEPLSFSDISKIAKKLESQLRELKIVESPSLPPFLSLLPLDGVVQFYSEESLGESGQRNSKPKTIIPTDPKDIVRKVDLNEDENYNPASILMESMQTADVFSGGLKRIDGSDELDEHLDGLSDLNIQEVVRTNKETESIFQADIAYEVVTRDDGQIKMEKEKHFFYYPEWNFRKSSYLKDWCRIVESRPDCNDIEKGKSFQKDVKVKHAKHIRDLRHQLDKIMFSRQWKNRQRDGEEIDIDAIVNALTAIHAGHSPDDRLYLSKRKRNKDVSILILLDVSLSSDSWVEGKRILDICQETIVILQEALGGLFDNIAIGAFNSQTRQNCRYHAIKEFGDDWNGVTNRLLAVEPDGYTRIGAALRHSLTKLSSMKSHKKVVILLSDGKPTDYDVYEGKYGIQDIRQVIREGKQSGIDVFSLAVDQQAKYYFPQMFGKNNFRVLKDPSYLADNFIQLFSKLI